jgi:hypothetical protein
VIRLPLPLAERPDWLRLFDPSEGHLLVPCANPPEVGADVHVDLTITPGGPRVILKGSVLTRQAAQGGELPTTTHLRGYRGKPRTCVTSCDRRAKERDWTVKIGPDALGDLP